MAASNVVRVLTLLLVTLSVYKGNALQSNYYQDSCPAAESTIATVVSNAISQDTRVAPAILRIFFHDCIVEGCDGSVLINSTSQNSEKYTTGNQNLQSFNVIDDAKAAVEESCAQTVSCADVVAFAAATSVAALGGPQIDMPGGRLDGFVSSYTEANQTIPSPTDSLSQLQSLFSSKGLSNQDLVILSGAHTIGKAHCASFSNRLPPNQDSSLNSALAATLEQECPSGVSTSTVVDMDVQTPTYFDNAYHQNVVNGKGLFTSDAQLYTSSSTSSYVDQYAANNAQFLGDFADALVKMGNIGIKTGSYGNIRKICSAFNSQN